MLSSSLLSIDDDEDEAFSCWFISDTSIYWIANLALSVGSKFHGCYIVI